MRRRQGSNTGLYPLVIGIVAAALGIVSIWLPLIVVPATMLIVWSSVWAYRRTRALNFTVSPDQWTPTPEGHRYVVPPEIARGRATVTAYITDAAGNLEVVLLDVKVTSDGGILLETGTTADEVHFRLQ
jgi:hypothetical protein